MSQQNIKRKNNVSILGLIILIATIFSLILLFLFKIVWLIFIPLILIFIVIFKGASHYFWESQKYCPRCKAPVTIYSEFCRNCGIRLIIKCPSCRKFFKAGTQFCNNCGFEFQIIDEEKDVYPFQVLKKGAPPPEWANFCPTCGVKLKKGENLKYCEICGSEID